MLDAKKLILIVDDDSANIQGLAQALSAAQTHDAYELRFAKSDAIRFVAAVDVLLYQAKNQGRNRCCSRSQDGTALTVLARP